MIVSTLLVDSLNRALTLARSSTSIRIAVLALLTSVGRVTFAQQVIQPENQSISLKGTIRLIHGFGPPGYGEDRGHDRHVVYWALEVPIPINTPCTPEKPEFAKYDCQPAKRLNLFFPGMELNELTDLPAARWRDRRVVVRGKLHRADTLGEMTPIYVDVATISGLPSATASNP
jgi:hypothetical protein